MSDKDEVLRLRDRARSAIGEGRDACAQMLRAAQKKPHIYKLLQTLHAAWGEAFNEVYLCAGSENLSPSFFRAAARALSEPATEEFQQSQGETRTIGQTIAASLNKLKAALADLPESNRLRVQYAVLSSALHELRAIGSEAKNLHASPRTQINDWETAHRSRAKNARSTSAH